MSGKYPGGFVTAGAPAGYSVYFDGAGDFLSLPTNTATALSNSNFTAEAWIYPTATISSTQMVIGSWDGTTTLSWYISVGATNGVGFGWTNTGSYIPANDYSSSSNVLRANAWNHVAAVRNGANLTVYVNGVSVVSSSGLSTTSFFNASNLTKIGSNSNNQHFLGYISNARLVVGTALYTSTFTPPTQLFPVGGTQLLTCQSPTIIDNSSNAFAITANGNAAPSTFTPFTGYTAGASGFNPALGAAAPGVWTLEEATYYQGNRLWPIYDPSFNLTTLMLHGNSPTNLPTWITDASTNNVAMTVVADTKAASQTPFSLTAYPTSGSGFFDGTGDYLNSGITAIGTSNFTVEYWSYLTAHGGTNGEGGYFQISGTAGGLSSTYTVGVLATRSAPGAGSVLNVIVGGTTISTTHVLGLNTWFHTSIVRSSNSVSVYVNGTLVSTPTTVSTNLTGTFLAVGGYFSTAYLCNGYISNFRVTNTAIVPPAGGPTAPLTAVSGTSLLTLQNAQPTANSSFTDSSTNNFPITRFGNTTQGTFTPFSQTGWSSYNPGSGLPEVGIYLNGETDFAFGTGDFTIELWINLSSKSYLQVIYDSRPDATNGFYPTIYMDNTVNKLKYFTNNADRITATSTFTFNTWHHVVVTRTGTSTKMFVNGAQEGSTYTDSNNYINGALRPFTGDGFTPSGVAAFTGVNGYTSNLRVVKGSGPYQSAGSTITVPTSQLTAVTNTVLLTLQSNRFIDTNTQASAKTINLFNGPSIQAFSPFAPTAAYDAAVVGGSGYFDGTGDYLTTPASGQFAPTGNFTIACSFYISSLAAQRHIIGNYAAAAAGNWLVEVTTGGALQVFLDGSTQRLGATGLTAGQWYYVTITRTGTTVTGQLNGSNFNGTATYTLSGTFGLANQSIWIGARNGGTNLMLGYISGIQLIDGSAVTTVPTVPPTPVAGTNLLLNYTNAGIIDSTAKNVLETVGGAGISTVQSKYGGSSTYFDGAGDYLFMPSTVTTRFGSANWTIEFWFRTAAATTRQIMVGWNSIVSGFAACNVNFLANGKIGLQISESGSSWKFDDTTTGLGSALSADTWYHVAVARSGQIITVYLNGFSIGTYSLTASTTSLMTNDTRNVVGINPDLSNQPFNGYIDDLRVTNGIARYTTNFTPPTSQLQSQ
jgi:hypothetical protein